MKYFFVQAANKCAETDSSGGKVGGEQQMCLGFELSLLIGGIFIFWAEQMLPLLLLVFRKLWRAAKRMR